MSDVRLFFPLLTRRKQYSVKRDGTYYANYGHYKEEIRADCLGRCVYCDTHENELDGSISMNLDHFRPKNYPEFRHLKNDPNNLVWACGACNRAKWDHWPALGTENSVIDGEGFIDPFDEDRLEYFDILDNGTIIGLKSPSEYLIALLNLNRTYSKNRRLVRLQSSRLLPLLEKQITLLEGKDDLTNEERERLEVLKRSWELTTARLDFSLKEEYGFSRKT